MNRTPHHLLPAIVLVTVGLAPRAQAHLVSSGVGPYYDGIAHFFVSPTDLLLVSALALFGGLSGPRAARFLCLTLPVAWLIGIILGSHYDLPAPPVFLVPVGIILVGVLAAINPRVPVFLPAVLGALLGALHGLQNGSAMTETNTSLLAALGIITALTVLTLLVGALAASLERGWKRIAARTVGSWAAAIALLALAWELRPGA